VTSDVIGRSGTGAGVSLPVLLLLPLITISSLLHTHLSPPHAVCDSPDQAAHYHTLGTKLGASALTRHLAGLGVKVVLDYIFNYFCISKFVTSVTLLTGHKNFIFTDPIIVVSFLFSTHASHPYNDVKKESKIYEPQILYYTNRLNPISLLLRFVFVSLFFQNAL
jgi:hypothetical protein